MGAARESIIQISGSYFEDLLDELNLTLNIRPTQPPKLPFPDHVHRLISLNGSPRRLELSESLLGVHAPFDGSMVLLQDIVKYCMGRCRQRRRRTPSFFNPGIAER